VEVVGIVIFGLTYLSNWHILQQPTFLTWTKCLSKFWNFQRFCDWKRSCNSSVRSVHKNACFRGSSAMLYVVKQN